jgi:hypothetical protein
MDDLNTHTPESQLEAFRLPKRGDCTKLKQLFPSIQD